jgi:hypothetical protein
MSIETLSLEQLRGLQRCAERLFHESRADLKLLYAAALRGIREEMKRRELSGAPLQASHFLAEKPGSMPCVTTEQRGA